MNEINLGVGFVTVNGPSQFIDCHIETLTWSPRLIRHFVPIGSFDFNALLMLISGSTTSISAYAVSTATNSLVLFGFLGFGHGKDGRTTNANSDETNP